MSPSIIEMNVALIGMTGCGKSGEIYHFVLFDRSALTWLTAARTVLFSKIFIEIQLFKGKVTK